MAGVRPALALPVRAALLLAVAAVAAGAAGPRVMGSMECDANPFTVHRVPDDENASYRLSQNVRPEHYDLFIVTNVGDGGKFEFHGRVNIKVNVFEDTEKIRFHAKHLELSNITVKGLREERTFGIKKQEPNHAEETVDLEMSQPLLKGGAYVIEIFFSGNLSSGLNGLYRSSYFDKESNTTRWLATTHFEPTAARKAFPCFDEPIMKATFTIVIGHNSSLTAISNMPAKKTELYKEIPGYSLTHFTKSVPMSTYLIAFVVSDFERVFSEKKEGEAQVSIWARRDAIDQMAYARDLSPLGLRFFEDYFQVKYPLPKQDMVAIPDFSAGAMENWGLITYREIQLLLDPSSTSKPTEAHLANTVVHEWAHQWFGNLVTMKWWSDLWLNEGFATYMAALAINKIHPDWNYLDEVVMENTVNVFAIDSLDSTHPVVRPLSHPDQIAQSFDHITYKKGSALLSMMQSFLGEEVFRQGVSNYIQKHKYSNAEQDDLWEALTEEAHKQNTLPECLTVKMVMDTWTVQSGFPVITVTRDYQNGLATVNQERYKSDANQAKDSTCWYVPLSYTSQDAPNFKEVKPRDWLTCNGKDKVINEVAPVDKWVIFNIGLRGLYRVQYDDNNWELIINAMGDRSERHRIGELNRVQLYLDSFALARSGRLSYSIPLRLTATLKEETGQLAWRAALGALGVLEHHARSTPHYEEFRTFVRSILTPEVKNMSDLAEEERGFQMSKHKTLILSWSCSHDVGSCVDDSLQIFKKWQSTADPDTENPVPRDMRRMVYCNSIKHGRPRDWSWLWQRYQNTNSAAERLNILSALSCTRDVWQMRRYLEWSLDSSSGVRSQDSEYIFSGVASTETGFYLAREFLYGRLPEISKQLGGSDSSRIGRWVGAIGSRLSTDRDLEEFIEFTKREEKYLKAGDQVVRQTVERAKIAVQWRKDHLQEMFDIIRKLNAMNRASS